MTLFDYRIMLALMFVFGMIAGVSLVAAVEIVIEMVINK